MNTSIDQFSSQLSSNKKILGLHKEKLMGLEKKLERMSNKLEEKMSYSNSIFGVSDQFNKAPFPKKKPDFTDNRCNSGAMKKVDFIIEKLKKREKYSQDYSIEEEPVYKPNNENFNTNEDPIERIKKKVFSKEPLKKEKTNEPLFPASTISHYIPEDPVHSPPSVSKKPPSTDLKESISKLKSFYARSIKPHHRESLQNSAKKSSGTEDVFFELSSDESWRDSPVKMKASRIDGLTSLMHKLDNEIQIYERKLS